MDNHEKPSYLDFMAVQNKRCEEKMISLANFSYLQISHDSTHTCNIVRFEDKFKMLPNQFNHAEDSEGL